MRAVLIFLLTGGFITVYGQKLVITGRVVDETGRPVPFASIQPIRTSGNGAATDINGNFKLEGIFNRDTLICSHTNYQTKKEQVFGNNKIVFRLIKNPPALTWLAIHADSHTIPIKQTVKVAMKDSLSRIEDYSKIFEKVEIPASFGKEPRSLERYLERNIIYPDSTSISFDATGEFEGIMTVHFTVDRTGKCVNAFVVKGLNDAVDQIVLDAVTSMPLWNPAIQNGRQVESEQEISIYFNVQVKSVKQ